MARRFISPLQGGVGCGNVVLLSVVHPCRYAYRIWSVLGHRTNAANRLTSDGSFPQVLGSLKEKRPRRRVLLAIALWPEHVGLQAARPVNEVPGFHVRISYTRVAAWIPCSLPPIRLAHFGFRLFYIQAYGYHNTILVGRVAYAERICRAPSLSSKHPFVFFIESR